MLVTAFCWRSPLTQNQALNDLKAPFGKILIFIAQVVGTTLIVLGRLLLGIRFQVYLFLRADIFFDMEVQNSLPCSPINASIKVGVSGSLLTVVSALSVR